MSKSLYQRLAEAANYGFELDTSDLQKGLKSDDPHVVWMAAKAAGEHRISSATDNLFDVARASGWPYDVDIASISSLSLSKIGGQGIVSSALALANAPNSTDRRLAADLLGLLLPERGLDVLRMLFFDESEEVQSWSALSLAKYGSSALAVLREIIDEELSLRQIILVIDALQKIGGVEALGLKAELLVLLPEDVAIKIETGLRR